jgi:hypothetical protein
VRARLLLLALAAGLLGVANAVPGDPRASRLGAAQLAAAQPAAAQQAAAQQAVAQQGAAQQAVAQQGAAQQAAAAAADDAGCRGCHAGIEEMHPWKALLCTECHGGNGAAPDAARAHVAPRAGFPVDERVLAQRFDPAAVRFRNPSDLRVAAQTCGQCHAREVERVGRSLHATTAGHLSDGLYENGLLPQRQSRYGVFAAEGGHSGDGTDGHDLPQLEAIERLRVPVTPQTLGDHFADLPRKACMQCHLWSSGVAVEGRLGQDGLYRGAGCAACHVVYAEDGRGRSADAQADRGTPGHPLKHELTSAPPTSTCTSCHVGDAAIGNGFRGLAQLYPQQPAGPDVPDTTDRLIAGQFFIRDPVLTPPDLHGAAGMDCVDCHTARDAMGDGSLPGAMEHAVEIECSDCHGSFDAYATGRTSRGRPLANLEQSGGLFVLRDKADGRSRRVKQVKDVLDPEHPDWNPRAAEAMTAEHAGLECYACHAGWNTSFFGFHFDRNLGFTQLDTITGARTPGRVTTQERVFASLRQFTLGINPEGEVAPYLVGFSSMGTVHGKDGELLLDQALPETAAGLSGMTMIHHQLHTTQPVARSCVECHRSPATWGYGTGDAATSSFALARGLLVVAGERGLDTLLLDRENPQDTLYLARLPLGGARKVVLDSDAVTGRASTAFVVIERAGVCIVDLRNPALPAVLGFAAAGDARDCVLAGDLLVIANGVGGLRLVDVSDRRSPQLVSDLVTTEARGLCVQWPRVLVADGAGGLLIADISTPSRPVVAGQLRLAPPDAQEDGDAWAVAASFQYGRPRGQARRSLARMVAVVANGRYGQSVVDVTEPSAARALTPPPGYATDLHTVDVVMGARIDLGDTTGQRPTSERDVATLLLVAPEGQRAVTALLDVTDPVNPAFLSRINLGPNSGLPPAGGLALLRSFNPPALVTRNLVAGEGGLQFQDVTRLTEGSNAALLPGVQGARDVAVEAFAFDRMQDETGRQLKDISHDGARFFTRAEIHRLLTVPGEAIGTVLDGGKIRAGLAEEYADRAVAGGDAASGFSARRRDVAQDEAMALRLAGGFRIAPEEDLARLVRHLSPLDFDDSRDGSLSRGELERLVFAALDANASGALEALEWPRHPGSDPGRLDRNHDRRLSRAEMDLGRDVTQYFDLDRDGLVQYAEWPWAVLPRPLPTLYMASVASLRKVLARPGFGQRRPELTTVFYGERSTADLTDEQLQQAIDRARGNPLIDVRGESAPPGFIARYDLDGDGAVDLVEFPELPRIAERCDLDADGKIDRRDQP